MAKDAFLYPRLLKAPYSLVLKKFKTLLNLGEYMTLKYHHLHSRILLIVTLAW